jgi:hypothetical protein
MGLFDIFKKNNKSNNLSGDNGILGPTYFDNLTEPISDPKKLQPHEWRRKLKATDGQTKFKIKFYGQQHPKFPNLIVGTDFAPSLVIAIAASSGQEILLFDGCKHGYNALFCDNYSDEQLKNRQADNFYSDEEGNDTFEIIISTFYGIDYDDEFSDEVDDKGLIEIVNGSKVAFQKVKRDGFDTITIIALTDKGHEVDIVTEELS